MDNGGLKRLRDSLGPYYRLAVSHRQVNENYWLARVTIRRADTDEEVDGVQVSGASEEMAMAHLVTRLEGYTPSILPVPCDWQKLEVRSLLSDYRKLNDELTSMLSELKKGLDSGRLQASSLERAFRTVQERSTLAALDFARRLAKLPESDLVGLMTAGEDVYMNGANPYNIDDLYARAALFEFIINPGPNVLAAHSAHMSRLDKES